MVINDSDNFVSNGSQRDSSHYDKLHSDNLLAFENVYKTFTFSLISELKEPLRYILFEYIEGEATSKKTEESLAKLLDKYSIEGDNYESAFEIIKQYQRAQGQILANKFDGQYFKYSGTIIDDSRQFCKERAGKIFSKDEIESWSNLEWDGKIENTNPDNIFFRCGGKGCRHTIRPVSEKMAKSEGFNVYNN
jgi:hypothetical protein